MVAKSGFVLDEVDVATAARAKTYPNFMTGSTMYLPMCGAT